MESPHAPNPHPTPDPGISRRACHCPQRHGPPRLVVLTGGPGAGKTAVLEIVRRHFCRHVAVLPEAASMLFGGGFPRTRALEGRMAAQRAIFHVQRELERLAASEHNPAVILCDRGTLDGLAYWPASHASFFEQVVATRASELARYACVIHLRTPEGESGYDHANPLRIESAREAHAIDERIVLAWEAHPRRVFVDAAVSFMEKASHAVEAVEREVREACMRCAKNGFHHAESISEPSATSSRDHGRDDG